MKTLLIFLTFLLIGCKGLVPQYPPGEYAFFYRKCKPINGIAEINGTYFAYNYKIPYNRTHNRIFNKNLIYLGNGSDYFENNIIRRINSDISEESCAPIKLQIDLNVVVQK